MGLFDDKPLALEIAAVLTVTLLIVAIVAAASGACSCAAVVHDVERALGDATLMTYAQAVAMKKAPPSPDQGKAAEEQDCCAFCLSEYADTGDLVRVVPACGHFFHAECKVDDWLRTRRTCPLCRGGLWPLPKPPRPECPPMPPRAGRSTAVVASPQ